jgi:hypothetical protein
MMNRKLIGALVLAASPTFCSGANRDWDPIRVDKEKNEVLFRNGKTFSSGLYEIKYLGQLPIKGKPPLLVLRGRECQECDAPISIFLLPADHQKLSSGSSQESFSYPGKLLGNPANGQVAGAVLDKTRTFFGDCLPSSKRTVVWFQNLNDSTKANVFVVSIDTEGGLIKKSITEDLPPLAYTEKKVREGLCAEIEPMDQTDAP